MLSKLHSLLVLCLWPLLLHAEGEKKPEIEVTPEAVNASIEKGVRFLIENQNEDGSWGGIRKTKQLNIYAPIPGGHHAFKMASTALAISGLCAHEKNFPIASECIDKAEKWLLETYPTVKRGSGDTLYNVWAIAYGLRAFTDLSQRREDKTPFIKAVQHQYDLLLKYELIGSGWAYYNFGIRSGRGNGIETRKPSGSNNSFMTGTVLCAIDYTREVLPLTIDEKRLDLSYKSLLRQRLPDGSYSYGEYLNMIPRHPVNRPAGAMSRTPTALSALLRRDENSVPLEEREEWVNRFITRHGFLAATKKRPRPHEGPFQLAGYFYYYGHYYVSELCLFLPDKEKYAPTLVKIIIEGQEKNGSWWDFPLYDYHEAYGTGYALSALARYL